MKRRIATLLLIAVMAITTGCGANAETGGAVPPPTAQTQGGGPREGLDGTKFTETRHITVEVFDRANDGGSKPEDNFYTNYIQEGMLRDHNVEVTFVTVPRWTEIEELNNLLAAGTAPDICLTYSYPTVQTYANMGAVIDLAPYVDECKDILPNLWDLLGERNIYWDKDPKTGSIYAIEALLASLARVNTFVREDWLKTLDIPEPTTLDEFHNMLTAFRDNAETLLGADADKLVPFSISYDVGWRAETLIVSFVPDSITDKTRYIYGFDDRRLLYPNYKEGVKVLNEWYNEGLIWKDFALYGSGDTTEENMMKAGYIGAYSHNIDNAYRNGEDSIDANLKRNIGPEAGFIAVDPFPNDVGKYKKYVSPPIDRKVFFPATNEEPVASLLYLDWISSYDNRIFLQYGEEGVTHETQADGSFKTIAASGDKIMNSPNNIDYVMTLNGHKLKDQALTFKTLAQGYAGVDSRYIELAYEVALTDIVPGISVNVGVIEAENGIDTSLAKKRDTFLNQSIVASTADFDRVYDEGMSDYLASGGQAIIDERAGKWSEFFGDAEMLP
ncbi:MAG: extracellular solute-binding protein [Clostridiales bacterium]|jgi:putative aldouronate transport system substrate-binding protein|nr:extracellular solute-binding protein [Clostridiales bacterium]